MESSVYVVIERLSVTRGGGQSANCGASGR